MIGRITAVAAAAAAAACGEREAGKAGPKAPAEYE